MGVREMGGVSERTERAREARGDCGDALLMGVAGVFKSPSVLTTKTEFLLNERACAMKKCERSERSRGMHVFGNVILSGQKVRSPSPLNKQNVAAAVVSKPFAALDVKAVKPSLSYGRKTDCTSRAE